MTMMMLMSDAIAFDIPGDRRNVSPIIIQTIEQ